MVLILLIVSLNKNAVKLINVIDLGEVR